MHIVVCMKQVPDSAQIRVHPVTNTIMRQGVPTIINPYDLFAIEEALRLRDQFGGEVTVLTMGPPSAEDSLRKALSFGVDRAVQPLLHFCLLNPLAQRSVRTALRGSKPIQPGGVPDDKENTLVFANEVVPDSRKLGHQPVVDRVDLVLSEWDGA